MCPTKGIIHERRVHNHSARRHTHFGPDQYFSCVSRHFKEIDCFTKEEMFKQLEASWSEPGMGRPQVSELTQVADVREWFTGHVDNSLQYHTESHQFKFERQVYNGEQQVVMSAKQFAATHDYVVAGNVLLVSLC